MTKPIIALGLLAAICAPLTALAADAQEDYADRYGPAQFLGTYVDECDDVQCWMVDDDTATITVVPRGVAAQLDPLYFELETFPMTCPEFIALAGGNMDYVPSECGGVK